VKKEKKKGKGKGREGERKESAHDITPSVLVQARGEKRRGEKGSERSTRRYVFARQHEARYGWQGEEGKKKGRRKKGGREKTGR